MDEYKTCIISLKAGKLDIHEDSLLIIYQVKGEWQTKDETKIIPRLSFDVG
jgi:hypothetical protein